MASLQGKHALVTGGGRGIGRAIAAALSEAGAAVTIAGRNEKPLAEVVGQGGAAGYVIADVLSLPPVLMEIHDRRRENGAGGFVWSRAYQTDGGHFRGYSEPGWLKLLAR